MTTEELNAIRKRAKDSISRIANDDEPGILPVRVIHEDVPALCAEVGRLRRAVTEARELLRAVAYITEDSSVTAWLKRYEN